MALRVSGQQLSVSNPFKLLADKRLGARRNMGYHTLVVVGATFKGHRPGFIILERRADPTIGDSGSGEELQNHAVCADTKRTD
jgi:CDP-diacylglycerol pyrophosphatase